MSFQHLGLSEAMVHAVQCLGYVDPSPIQEQAIPLAIEGRDLIGAAQTGTGKTAAFSLPILTKLERRGKLRCLVLEPTRELAVQVDEAFREHARFTNLRVTVIYGGVGYGKQTEELKRGTDVVVATPGRLLDLQEQGLISLSDIQFLVLDEVDRMLDMGFLPDVRKIIGFCPEKRQTLMFTATMPPEIERLAGFALKEPAKVEIGARRSPAETVTHAFYPVATSQKFDLLHELLERTEYRSVIVFSRTKQGADLVASRLEAGQHKVAVLHSDRSQNERLEALEGFKSGKYEVLVATDIAARGLDISGVTHVVNYDVPLHPEDYVHRIGRTGRASAEGDAFTLITADEIKSVQAIERFIGQKIPRLKLENFPYTYTVMLQDEKKAADFLFGRKKKSAFAAPRRKR
jgi:ATP-dependent RNA helicase RhlE